VASFPQLPSTVGSYPYVSDEPIDEDVLLAVALGSGTRERRMLPDRRSGIERRRRDDGVAEAADRRSGEDRRRFVRRQGDIPGGLLQRGSSTRRMKN
jgi:hypothetical protein